MKPEEEQIKIMEAAVRRHHPSQAVLFEAGALDRELQAENRSWDVLLRSMESFCRHYPAVLLRSPDAMQTLGHACLQGVRQAAGMAMHKRASSLLVMLLMGVLDEVEREGPETVPGEVPGQVHDLLQALGSKEEILPEHGQLVAPLLTLGRKIVMVGGEGHLSEMWFESLGCVNALLVGLLQHRVRGEPSYDGRWDGTRQEAGLEVSLLEAVRLQCLEQDLDWLGRMDQDLRAHSRPEVDLFLELSAYTHRDEREAAWHKWFDEVARRAQEGQLQPGTLRKLCRAIGDWIRQAQDRRFLSNLAAIVKRTSPRMAAAHGEPGLAVALDTIGRAIVERLETEAARGEVDAALVDLRAALVDVLQYYLELAQDSKANLAVELGLRARSGPVLGQPLSRQDVIWRTTISAKHSEMAGELIASCLVGLSLEDVLLRDDRSSSDQTSVMESLSVLLDQKWESGLRHMVRALVRVTPLSPFHVGGPTTRAHLMALDPENQKGSYLHDLRERVLSRTGAEALASVESVLDYWRSGDTEYLDNLASPRSLTALPVHAQRDHIEHIQELIERLGEHVPVRTNQGTGWLARMPEAYYQTGSLVKVAGFAGCSSRALTLLHHLLHVYRALTNLHCASSDASCDETLPVQDLLAHSGSILGSRRELLADLFGEESTPGRTPLQRLERFERDQFLVVEEDRLLADLIHRGLDPLDRHKADLAGQVLGHVLRHAALSGLGASEFPRIADLLDQHPVTTEPGYNQLEQMAGLLASIRNQYAEALHAHVQDSAQRLLENPLARPAVSYREMFEVHREKGAERLAVELGTVLLDDLLGADGGFLLLEELTHRLLHLLEQY